MLKRIKIVTSLLLVLAVFGLLQLTSGGLFFNALKNDKRKFHCFTNHSPAAIHAEWQLGRVVADA